MVKSSLWRYALLIWSMVLLFFVLQCHVSDTQWSLSKNDIARRKALYTDALSVEEVEHFMTSWPEFKELGFSEYTSQNTPLISAQKINWSAQIWFVYHRWDAERFFYVKQRIVEIMEEIKRRELAESLIEALEKTPDSPGVQAMIELQNKILENDKYSVSELLIIKSRQNKLKKMLSY